LLGETMQVAPAGLPATVGAPAILPAYMVAINNGTAPPSFLVADGSGNLSSLGTYSATALDAAAGGTQVVDATASVALTGSRSVAALRVSGTSAISGTAANQVVIGAANGGVIFNGTATHTAAFNFGANEGLVFVNSGATATLTSAGGGLGGVLGTNGLTKFGAGQLTIQQTTATAPALTGGVVISGGTLALQTNSGLSAIPIGANNALTVNNGALTLRIDAAATYFASTQLNGPFTTNVDRAGGTNTNFQLNLGNLTVGAATNGQPVVVTGTTGNSVRVAFGGTTPTTGTVTLNQDLVLNGGRVDLNGVVTGAGRSIVMTGGARLWLNNTNGTNSFGSLVNSNGELVVDQAGTYALGAPAQFLGSTATMWNGAAAALTSPVHLYSGSGFTGGSSVTLTAATVGTPDVPTPMTLALTTSNTGTNTGAITRLDNPNVGFTSLALTGTNTAQSGAIRYLVLNKGTGTWNVSGPIELQGHQAWLHLMVPGVANAGDVPAGLDRLTTLRANAGATFTAGGVASQVELSVSRGSNDATGNTALPRVQFTQTILDSNLRIDPQNGGVGTAGPVAPTANNAHVGLGDIIVNGDRQLWIFDAINPGSGATADLTQNGASFGAIRGRANSILRLTTNNTTVGNARLITDQTGTMLGAIYLTNGSGTAGVFSQTVSGALGAQGAVTNARLDVGATPLSSKDNYLLLTGGVLSGAAMSQIVRDGPATGPRLVVDPTATYGSNGLPGLGVTTATFAQANLPQLAGTMPNLELRLLADVNVSGAGSNTAFAATIGGANGLLALSTDGNARSIFSGTLTAAGPFILQTRAGNLTLGGNVASTNNVFNIVAPTGLNALPTGYKPDAIVTAATNNGFTLLLSGSSGTAAAGDLSGVRNFVITGGAYNQAVGVQAQQANSLGGTATGTGSRAGAVLLMGANTTANSLNPGSSTFGSAAATSSGQLTFHFGSVLTLDDPNNVTTSSGQIVMRPGSVANVTNATTLGGVPTIAPVINPGNVVRLGISSATNLAAVSNAATEFVVQGGTTQTSFTLNRDASVPWSGTLASDVTARTLTLGATGVIIGTNGGILAGGTPTASATTGVALTYGGTLTTNGNPVQIGHQYLVDGRQHGGGSQLGAGRSAAGGFTYTGTSVLNTGGATPTFSPLSIAAGATFTVPAGALNGSGAAANSLSADGALVVTGAGLTARLGAYTTTGYGLLRTPAGAGSRIVLDTLARANGGMVFLNTPTAAALGGNEQVSVTNAPPSNVAGTGIAAPYIVNVTDVPTAAGGPSGFVT
ncbi:MAG TPA: hypothetical protein VF796_24375, partial [Humisphaera sp.]